MKFISKDYYISGNSVLRFQEADSHAPNEERKQFKKSMQGNNLLILPRFQIVAAEDESAYPLHDASKKKDVDNLKNTSIETGDRSHQRIRVFGSFTIDAIC